MVCPKSTLANDLLELVDDKSSADITFLVGRMRQPVYAHRSILVVRSAYFRARDLVRMRLDKDGRTVTEQLAPGVALLFRAHLLALALLVSLHARAPAPSYLFYELFCLGRTFCVTRYTMLCQNEFHCPYNHT